MENSSPIWHYPTSKPISQKHCSPLIEDLKPIHFLIPIMFYSKVTKVYKIAEPTKLIKISKIITNIIKLDYNLPIKLHLNQNKFIALNQYKQKNRLTIKKILDNFLIVPKIL